MSNKEKWLWSYIISQVFLLILTTLYFTGYFIPEFAIAFKNAFGGKICPLETFVPILLWNIIIEPPVFRAIIWFLEAYEKFMNRNESEKEE